MGLKSKFFAGLVLTALLAGFAAASPVQDIRAHLDGHNASLEIVFDRPVLAAEIAGDRSVVVAGMMATPSRWELDGVFPVRALALESGEGGTRVSLQAEGQVTITRVNIADGAVTLFVKAHETGFGPVSRLADVRSSAKGSAEPSPVSEAKAAHQGVKAASEASNGAPARKPSEDGHKTPASTGAAKKESAPEPSAEASTGVAKASPVQPMKARERAVASAREAEALELISEGKASADECERAIAAVSADAWDIDNLRQMAICNAQDGKWKQAQESYERILAFAPDDPVAHMGLSVLKTRQNDRKAAEEHLLAAGTSAQSDGEAAKVRLLQEALLGKP